MFFKNRSDAGKLLTQRLQKYNNSDVVVYALPRGGVVVAAEIAKALNAPLELILAHKIGHPNYPEYAIGAISESGHLLGNSRELQSVDSIWLENEMERQLEEIRRKREKYVQGRDEVDVKGKIALLVDDGIATGRTMEVGIQELRDKHPKMIVAVVPVAPQETAEHFKTLVDDFVALEIPEEGHFLGAVGAYYDEFYQVEDEEVIAILQKIGSSHK